MKLTLNKFRTSKLYVQVAYQNLVGEGGDADESSSFLQINQSYRKSFLEVKSSASDRIKSGQKAGRVKELMELLQDPKQRRIQEIIEELSLNNENRIDKKNGEEVGKTNKTQLEY